MMGAESYWNAGITGQGIKVAVVDTGINFRHPFLKDTVFGGYTPFGNKTDPDSYADVHGHGSHVAGIIHQVAPKAGLLAVRVFSADDGGTTPDVIEKGLRWAIDNGAKVINLSLGGPEAPNSWTDVFRYGASKGVLFAVASGNDRGFMPLFPAVFAGTIPAFGFSVGALDELENLAVFSNWTGNNLNIKQISSHGHRVLSVDYDNEGFVSMSGTSMAAPQIAGFLALARQANPNASSAEIIQILSEHVKRAAIND
jgi:subtilisin family serine protease